MPAFPQGLHRGTVVPLDRRNVDTDAIFPTTRSAGPTRSSC
jgi:3-isopropylmalate dehydratase small subunit